MIDLVLQYMFPGRGAPMDWYVATGKIREWYMDAPQPSEAELLAVANSEEFKAWRVARLSALIDRDTGAAIDKEVHPFAGLEEQIGILRDQLAHIINELGLTPTTDFERLNSIAVTKIEEGAKKKEALNAEDDKN